MMGLLIMMISLDFYSSLVCVLSLLSESENLKLSVVPVTDYF